MMMNPWLNFWLKEFYLPLSGAVTQDIDGMANVLSPQLAFHFAGDQEIEAEVIGKVASYGKQLGALTEVVLELSDGRDSEAVRRLERLAEEISQVKQQHQIKLAGRAKESLDALKMHDPEAFRALLASYQQD